MENKKMNSVAKMWWWTSVALIIFPPVGLIVAIINCKKEKYNHVYGEDYILGPAAVAIAFAIYEIVLMIFVQLSGDDTNSSKYIAIAVGFFTYGLAILGAFIMINTRKHFSNLDKQLVLLNTLVEKGYITDTEEIAQYMNITWQEAENIIEYAIEKGRLQGYIFEKTVHRVKNTDVYKYFRYKCNYCGADQQLMRGRDITCPFCGNPVDIK